MRIALTANLHSLRAMNALAPMLMSHLTPTIIKVAVAVVGGYFLGSVPFGVIATRLGGAGDIRKVGSGNIGATNVLRTGRRDLAALTLIGDGAKGAAAVLLAAWLLSPTTIPVFAGGAAFLGHLFPVWLKFRGGKGVATFFGVLLAMSWPVGLTALAIWLLLAALFRYSSLAALAAAAWSPLIFFVLHQATTAKMWLAIFMAVLIFIRHHQNIRRLLNNIEPRIGDKTLATP